VYDAMSYGEMLSFVVKNGKPQAERNAHDDLIMSLAIAWQMYQMNLQIEIVATVNQSPSIEVHKFPENQILDEYGFY
jgi:hypothetical protein